MSAHIKCLAKGSGGKGCLASKALEAVVGDRRHSLHMGRAGLGCWVVRWWVQQRECRGLYRCLVGRASSCGCPDGSDRMVSGRSGSYLDAVDGSK